MNHSLILLAFCFLNTVLFSSSSNEKRTVLIFRNGGNNTIDDWSVTAHPEDFKSLWELTDYGAFHLGVLPSECSVFGNKTSEDKEFCRKYYYDIFNQYGEQIFSLKEIQDNDWLYVVLVTDHWFWPGHYVGRKLLIRDISKDTGREIIMETMSLTPRIFQIYNFLSNEEASKIISIAENYLEPSYMVKKDRGTYYEQGRNSYQAWLKKSYGPMINSFDERLGKFARIPPSLELEEQLQILRYFPNQHYYTHHDYFDRDPPTECNRLLTLLFYMNDVEEGGETVFPLGNNSPYEQLTFNQDDCKRGIAVKPLRNSLVLFYNLKPESQMLGTVDDSTLHLGCDVIKGMKWAGNKWIHNKACGR